MNQRGFILPTGIMAYAAVGVAVVIAMLSAGLWAQTKRLEATKSEYAQFVAQAKAAGDAQEVETRKTNEHNAKQKELADHEITTSRAIVADLAKRLRDERSHSSIVPRSTESATLPDAVCYTRSKVADALSSFEEGIAGLLAEGDNYAVNLECAAKWARGIGKD